MKAATRLALALTLAIGLGCTRQDWIDRTLVTEDVTGSWLGSTEGPPARPVIQFELQQQGARVTGVMKVAFGSASAPAGVPIEGSMTGDVFSFKDSRGVFSGELTVSGDDMTGRIFGGGGTRKASLRRETAASQTDS